MLFNFWQVESSLSSDNYGNPIYNEWLQAAYLMSEPCSQWAYNLQIWRDDQNNQIESKNEIADYDDDYNQSTRNDQFNRYSGRPYHRNDSSLIHIGDSFSPSEVAASFTLDWTNTKFEWLSSMNDSKRVELQSVVRGNYDIICALFTHYCGVGKGILHLVNLCTVPYPIFLYYFLNT